MIRNSGDIRNQSRCVLCNIDKKGQVANEATISNTYADSYYLPADEFTLHKQTPDKQTLAKQNKTKKTTNERRNKQTNQTDKASKANQ